MCSLSLSKQKTGRLSAPRFFFSTNRDGYLAAADTVRPLASTLFTPLTALAIFSALLFSFAVATVPVRATTPSVVVTEISLPFTAFLVANSDFTLVVIQASSVLPATVWLSAFAAAGVESWAFTWANGTVPRPATRAAANRALRRLAWFMVNSFLRICLWDWGTAPRAVAACPGPM